MKYYWIKVGRSTNKGGKHELEVGHMLGKAKNPEHAIDRAVAKNAKTEGFVVLDIKRVY